MSAIAILDDGATNRQIYSRLAATIEDQVSVQAFGDPAAALQVFARSAPDLVITDFRMPGLNGAEFTRSFRALPQCEDVPVVVVTAYHDRSYRLRALEAGATDFLNSPVDHAEFITRARNLLRMHRQQQLIKARAENLEQRLHSSEQSREKLLRDSREALAQVIDTLPAAISAVDRTGRCVFVNSYQATMLGASPADLVGRPFAAPGDAARAERNRELDQEIFRTGTPLLAFEEDAQEADGRRIVLLTTKTPLRDASNEIVCVLTASLDITERKLAERRLRHMVHHDALTGLPNRVFLREELQRAAKLAGRPFALHFLDLDHFKSVNDALGHRYGDLLLQEVARRLRSMVREQDVVARLGGDEFAVIQYAAADREDAARLAARLIHAVGQPSYCDGRDVAVGVSIGITFYPTDGPGIDDLLSNADLAMYRAKEEGRGAFRFYEPVLNKGARTLLRVQSDLRLALSQQQFELHYQPQVDLRGGAISGAEALLRWRRPEHGLVAPGDFLPVAEQTDLMLPIDLWVLQTACRQAVQWQVPGRPPVRVGVNVSPIHFRRHDVHRLVTEVLAESGLDPSLLELELTENVLMDDSETAVGTLRALKDLGVRISIDDFGMGYSSLNYIRRFPIDRLKIDRSFVDDLDRRPNDAAIVRAIISLGHSLKLDVIAEGVETAEQLHRLVQEGCDSIQGFYFSPAIEEPAFAALVAEGARLAQATTGRVGRSAMMTDAA